MLLLIQDFIPERACRDSYLVNNDTPSGGCTAETRRFHRAVGIAASVAAKGNRKDAVCNHGIDIIGMILF
ncbi:hypothetical protein DW078_07175 [Bacteroides fragilis]|nr:hypothetical protein DW078_07175 [Bacteroides fragilis]